MNEPLTRHITLELRFFVIQNSGTEQHPRIKNTKKDIPYKNIISSVKKYVKNDF